MTYLQLLEKILYLPQAQLNTEIILVIDPEKCDKNNVFRVVETVRINDLPLLQIEQVLDKNRN